MNELYINTNEGPSQQGQIRLYLSSQCIFLDLRVKPKLQRIIKKTKTTHRELSMVLTWACVCVPYLQGDLAPLSLDLAKCSSDSVTLLIAGPAYSQKDSSLPDLS